MIWLDDFERALGGVRMPARRRRRIYLELEDHLASDATAADRLADPLRHLRGLADCRAGGFLARDDHASGTP